MVINDFFKVTLIDLDKEQINLDEIPKTYKIYVVSTSVEKIQNISNIMYKVEPFQKPINPLVYNMYGNNKILDFLFFYGCLLNEKNLSN